MSHSHDVSVYQFDCSISYHGDWLIGIYGHKISKLVPMLVACVKIAHGVVDGFQQHRLPARLPMCQIANVCLPVGEACAEASHTSR